jgi:hypothetical protein
MRIEPVDRIRNRNQRARWRSFRDAYQNELAGVGPSVKAAAASKSGEIAAEARINVANMVFFVSLSIIVHLPVTRRQVSKTLMSALRITAIA